MLLIGNGKLFTRDEERPYLPDGAVVIDGDTVVVSSPEVKEPAAVRYGWVSYAGNLNFYNKDGFPACPFRTDMPDYVK